MADTPTEATLCERRVENVTWMFTTHDAGEAQSYLGPDSDFMLIGFYADTATAFGIARASGATELVNTGSIATATRHRAVAVVPGMLIGKQSTRRA